MGAGGGYKREHDRRRNEWVRQRQKGRREEEAHEEEEEEEVEEAFSFLFFFLFKKVCVRFRGMHRESEHVGCLRDVSSSEKAHRSINISHNGRFFRPACAPTSSTNRNNTEERAINGHNDGFLGIESSFGKHAIDFMKSQNTAITWEKRSLPSDNTLKRSQLSNFRSFQLYFAQKEQNSEAQQKQNTKKQGHVLNITKNF